MTRSLIAFLWTTVVLTFAMIVLSRGIWEWVVFGRVTEYGFTTMATGVVLGMILVLGYQEYLEDWVHPDGQEA